MTLGEGARGAERKRAADRSDRERERGEERVSSGKRGNEEEPMVPEEAKCRGEYL